jgi:D-amino-acid dehydrogenase
VPRRPIVVDSRKAALVPLGNRIRVAGTLEFTGWDTSLDATRGRMLEDGLHDILPELPSDRGRTHPLGRVAAHDAGRPARSSAARAS